MMTPEVAEDPEPIFDNLSFCQKIKKKKKSWGRGSKASKCGQLGSN